ncbi:hypothetical protein HPB48_008106 [Haemaphysalis longicornis]|uniref:Uncharacterized protein n=1 Tax=Haemaphysalis longicornis TaxID=44386 RepID=A0A9J6GK04_HAELO|nr:hypothetical protein HPB48_008106 [Haemaphysalis longicornis]
MNVEGSRSWNSISPPLCWDTLPEHIYVANVRSPVHLKTPGPLRCYKCGRLNHIRVPRRHATRCERSAGDHDEADGNESQLKCANCQQDHKFSFPQCPPWQKEKKVLMEAGAKIQLKQAGIELLATRNDGRQTGTDGRTYAQTATNNKTQQAQQTSANNKKQHNKIAQQHNNIAQQMSANNKKQHNKHAKQGN